MKKLCQTLTVNDEHESSKAGSEEEVSYSQELFQIISILIVLNVPIYQPVYKLWTSFY